MVMCGEMDCSRHFEVMPINKSTLYGICFSQEKVLQMLEFCPTSLERLKQISVGQIRKIINV